jgi:putative ABC transport system permease protein
MSARRPSDDDSSPRLPAWRRYVRFWGTRVDADVDDELAFHVEMRAREYVARGMNEHDARAAAMHRVGDLPTARNACLTIGHRRHRRMTRTQIVDALAQDLRYALRTLNRQRAWTTVAVVTLGLGIGASTAVFSVVNSLLLHPLAYRDADRVAMIWRVDPKSTLMLSPEFKMLEAWRAQSRTVEAIESFQTADMTLTGQGDATVLHTAAVRPSFGAFVGIAPIAGRSFVAEDVTGTGGSVALLSEALWRQRFGGAANTVGTRVTLNDKIYTVVGIVPSAFRLPTFSGDGATDVWLALGRDTRTIGGMTLARLRPGVSRETASKELDRIVQPSGLMEKFGSKEFVAKLVKPGDLVGFKSSLFLLSAAVALLLLVACANVAHLLLARGATRERELAIRTALGAGAARLARQLLTEASVLAGAGCAAGVALGYAGVRLLLVLRPRSLSELAPTQMDSRALVLAVGLSVVTGIVFGLTAAIHAVRHSTSDSLRATALSGTGVKRSHRLRSMLVVTEMALSAMLLVGAVLLPHGCGAGCVSRGCRRAGPNDSWRCGRDRGRRGPAGFQWIHDRAAGDGRTTARRPPAFHGADARPTRLFPHRRHSAAAGRNVYPRRGAAEGSHHQRRIGEASLAGPGRRGPQDAIRVDGQGDTRGKAR